MIEVEVGNMKLQLGPLLTAVHEETQKLKAHHGAEQSSPNKKDARAFAAEAKLKKRKVK